MIAAEANFEDIRRAYIRLAKQHHPDFTKNANNRRMSESNAAYEVLSNPSKKEEYNQRFRPFEINDFTKKLKKAYRAIYTQEN